MISSLFSFPNPVNEHAARLTAGLVVILALATIFTAGPLRLGLLSLLTAGFVLRVAGGPRYSPFGRLSVHVLVPLLGAKPVWTAGPPKRFAQVIGLVVSGTALGFTLLGWPMAATLMLLILAVAASLESLLGFCLGCEVFGLLMRSGVIPESVCEECASVSKGLSNVSPNRIHVQHIDVGVQVHKN